MVDLQENATQGIFVSIRQQDILSTFLNNFYHPGHVIGVGYETGLFQTHGQASKHKQQMSDIVALTA